MEIVNIAVLGAGTMGRGIAHVAALAGYETELVDVDAAILARAEEALHRTLDKGVALGKVPALEAEGAKSRLALDTDLAAAVEGRLAVAPASKGLSLGWS